MRSVIGASVCAVLLTAVPRRGREGKWTPQQVLEQGPAWVKAQGFGLPLDKLWDPRPAAGCWPTRSSCRAARAASSRPTAC